MLRNEATQSLRLEFWVMVEKDVTGCMVGQPHQQFLGASTEDLLCTLILKELSRIFLKAPF